MTEVYRDPYEDCGPDCVRRDVILGNPDGREHDECPERENVCEDCGVVLTEDNTEVDRAEAFWLNVTWDKEQFCKSCKDNRADGESPTFASSYEPIGYREDMVHAGRGYLL